MTDDGIVGFFSSSNPRPVLNDPRVVESSGGGWAPEQHTGTLTDGRRFYFRTRHGYAQLHVNTVEACEAEVERSKQQNPDYWDTEEPYPPCINPEWNSRDFDEANLNNRDYHIPFYLDEVADETLPHGDFGSFDSQENRDACFKRLLDEIESAG